MGAIADAYLRCLAIKDDAGAIKLLKKEDFLVRGYHPAMFAASSKYKRGDVVLAAIPLLGTRARAKVLAQIAAVTRSVKLLDAILAAGLNPNARVDGTPLLVGLAVNGPPAMITRLLDAGADVNATRPRDGRTALHVAAKFARPDVGLVLIGRGANLEAKDQNGNPPLVVAFGRETKRRLRLIDALLGAGAKVSPHAIKMAQLFGMGTVTGLLVGWAGATRKKSGAPQKRTPKPVAKAVKHKPKPRPRVMGTANASSRPSRRLKRFARRS